VVYLHLLFDFWVTCHHLYGARFLEKHQALYASGKKKSPKILIYNTLEDSIFFNSLLLMAVNSIYNRF